jgi:26S proteasome regulatory subunit N2
MQVCVVVYLLIIIIFTGGRNVTISLVSRATQDADMCSVAGMLLFQQHWYWHAITHTVALTFKPTALIALNKNLKV